MCLYEASSQVQSLLPLSGRGGESGSRDLHSSGPAPQRTCADELGVTGLPMLCSSVTPAPVVRAPLRRQVERATSASEEKEKRHHA